MAGNLEQGTDAGSIQPVSSLRSHFEGLKASQSQQDERGSIPVSPHTLKPTSGQSPVPTLRASLDLPRPISPWTGGGSLSYGGPPTPIQMTDSPPKPGHKRPMSMLVQSSPQLTPSVKVDSPRSPPRTYFERSASRSPEQVDNTPFAKVRELISQHSSASSTRPPTPRAVSGDRSSTLRLVRNDSVPGEGPGSKSPARPPPVNRAEKPKIPSKPSAISMPAGLGLNPNARRPSVESRVSPFSTPPSSEENSPSQSPKIKRNSQTAESLPTPNRVIASPAPFAPTEEGYVRQNDARFMGFSARPPAAERRDSRTLGFPTPDPRPPSRGSTLPTRASTVSEKPSRDPRDFGLSTGTPTPRHVSETIRSTPSTPPVQPPRPIPIRDARTLGFSAQHAPDNDSSGDEVRPGLPPRRNMQPPPRPSNESKNNTIRTGAPTSHPPVPDRSQKVTPNPSVSRTPTLPIETRFPPPPKRASIDETENALATRVPRAQTFAGDAQNRPPVRVTAPDSDDAEEVAEEPKVAKSEYPDSTHTNRRPPRSKAGIWEISTKSDSRTMEVCGRYLCTAGYTTRVFDMSSGEQIMSINHGETVKVSAAVFKPAVDLANEGFRLWLGTNTGDLMEVDVVSHTIMTTNTSHNRREIVRILRNRRDLWTLDDDGKLFVWEADETGVPNLKYSHGSHKVQKGHSCSLAINGQLWLACGKEIRVYNPGNDNSFNVLSKPLSQPGNLDITCGTFSSEQGGRAYFGHIDGRVSIYSTKDYSAIANVKASDYKINSLSFVGDKLWAAYKTGMVYVYDTSTSPWKVKKDWRAHNGPATDIILDPSSVWALQRLQVATIGHDNVVRLWDAALEDDWIEAEMQERDVEYCTFREVRAAVVTWNVGASTPYDLRSDFIAEAIHARDPPEILVFGFQEVVDLEDRAVTAKSILGFGKKKDTVKTEQHQSRVYREWRDYLSKMISRYTSDRYAYSELQTSSLIGLFQCVFIRQEERPRVRNLQAASIKLGLKGHYGNKGALVTRFFLDDSSICFINCHLAAGQTQTSHRNNDVASILEAEALDPEPDPDIRSSLYIGGGDGTQILDHEICILNGDLNYRIDTIPRDTVINMVKRGELSKLLERDQMMVSRRRVSGFRLSAFTELPITFAPTYKYDVGSDEYDSSEKKRAPAWCDRLLYRGPGRVKQIEYRRHDGVRTSDHRPVSGLFKLRVKTIDPVKRQRVKEDCFAKFESVKRRMAEKASVEYLVSVLGLSEQEAKRLLGAK
ncbi:putative inositol polyphosphate 5-phosphatase C9G1.10c [Exophiala dermatitidis]